MFPGKAALLSQEIIAAVRENAARLAGCAAPHNFERVEAKLFAKYRCTICGGKVDCVNAHWYRLGLDHAKR